jgi:hypothetical protein
MSTNNIDELQKIKELLETFFINETARSVRISSRGVEGWSVENHHSISDITTIIEQADKIKALTTFVDWVLDAVVSGSDICGGDAQDKMYELGILTREIYNPEIHTLQQGSECEAGDYIYFKAGDL